MNQPYNLFRQRQHEDVVWGCHGPDQWRQMESVGDFCQRLRRVRKSKGQCHRRCGEHPEAMGLVVPERFDRIRLGALKLADLVFVLNVALRSRQAIELRFEGGYFGPIRTGFSQLRQCLLGKILEREAI